MTKRSNEKILKAYNFFLKKETENKLFTLIEIANYTGWRNSTIKTYITKQWKKLIFKSDNKKDKYFCKGISNISQDDFIKVNSQKEKFDINLRSESEELLFKAREFSLLAIYNYNSPFTEFRTYAYIVNIIIAWTALFHAIFSSKGIEFFYKSKNGDIEYIDGVPKAWELTTCLKNYALDNTELCSNLELLIKLRNQIEHRDTPLIDKIIAGHCQACLNNFEEILIKEFGEKHALTDKVSLALQLTNTREYNNALIKLQQQKLLPLLNFIDDYESKLSPETLKSPKYRICYILAPTISNQKTSAHEVVTFVKADSEEAKEIERIVLKEKEKNKYKPKQIVTMIQNEGFEKFSMHMHTNLWQQKNAKKNDSYGVQLSDGQWYWYDSWVNIVRNYCKKHNL